MQVGGEYEPLIRREAATLLVDFEDKSVCLLPDLQRLEIDFISVCVSTV